jgi:hypothetical protein
MQADQLHGEIGGTHRQRGQPYRAIWPGEHPFQTPRQVLLKELRTQLRSSQPDPRYHPSADHPAEFSYAMHMQPREISSNIGTSTLLAAWNAAIYVAQIEDDRGHDAMSRGDYLHATQAVLQQYQGLWFTDEAFVVTRQRR